MSPVYLCPICKFYEKSDWGSETKQGKINLIITFGLSCVQGWVCKTDSPILLRKKKLSGAESPVTHDMPNHIFLPIYLKLNHITTWFSKSSDVFILFKPLCIFFHKNDYFSKEGENWTDGIPPYISPCWGQKSARPRENGRKESSRNDLTKIDIRSKLTRFVNKVILDNSLSNGSDYWIDLDSNLLTREKSMNDNSLVTQRHLK